MTRWAVVLAGGVGSRFWPLSTEKQPKQLLPLVAKKPLLVEQLERLRLVAPPARTLGLAGPWPLRTESRIYCPAGGTVQIRPIVAGGRVVGTRLLVMRKDAATPSIHVLDGRHPIVDVSLRAKGGGISFDPAYCDRTSIS